MKEESQALLDAISDYCLTKAQWTTYYVDPDGVHGYAGDDNNSGETWNEPFATIQAALDKSENGAIIYVAAGTYDENVTIAKSYILLKGDGEADTIIAPSSAGTKGIYLTGHGCTISDLKVNTPTNGYGIYLCGSSNTLDNVNVESSAGAIGVYARTALGGDCYALYATIKNCILVGGDYPLYSNHTYTVLEKNTIAGGSGGTGVAYIYEGEINENDFSGGGFLDDGITVVGDEVQLRFNNFRSFTLLGTICIDNGTGNVWYMNYYQDGDHTDTNGDGICDNSYAIAGTAGSVDLNPVVAPNSWKTLRYYVPNSTGTISSVWNELLAGYITADSAGKHLSDVDANVVALVDDIGDFSSGTNLLSLHAMIGKGWDIADKDMYTLLITDLLGHGTIGLAAIEALVDAIQTDVGDASGDSTTIHAQTRHINKTPINVTVPPVANTLADILHKDGNYTYDNTTDSLEAIADLTAEIKVYLGSIRTALLSRRFYSDPQASATLDTTGTTDVALPSVTIPAAGIPTDAVIEAVFATVLIGHRKDTSGSDNAINGDQYIQVKESVAGSYTNAIKISDNTFPIDVSEATVIGGPVVFGNIDVVSQVSAVNKTYNFQWTNTRVDGNNMILYDIQTMLEVLYTVP